MLHLKQQYHHESLYSPTMSRIPATIHSSSSWHPIQSSPSEDMWELPASSSSMSDERDDFPVSAGLQNEFTIYHDDCLTLHSNGNIHGAIHNNQRTMPPTVTIRATRSYEDHRLYSPGTRNNSNRGGSAVGLKKGVLGDATNTVRTRNHNTRHMP